MIRGDFVLFSRWFRLCSEQQLSRKRFIGNDLVVFIFLEGDEPFDASMITSQMCHTFIVVKKIASKPTRYRVSVVAKPGLNFNVVFRAFKKKKKKKRMQEFPHSARF